MVVAGIMLSTVGMDPLGGTLRFTFDLGGAQAGLSFVAVTAGLFGVAEVLATVAEPSAATPVARVRLRELYPSREEMRRAVPPMLRGTAVGFLVGLIPGPAATIASFASYGVERRGLPSPGGARARRDRGRGRSRGREQRGGRGGHDPAALARPALHAVDRRPPGRDAARGRHPRAVPDPRPSSGVLGCDRQLLRRQRDAAAPEPAAGGPLRPGGHHPAAAGSCRACWCSARSRPTPTTTIPSTCG